MRSEKDIRRVEPSHRGRRAEVMAIKMDEDVKGSDVFKDLEGMTFTSVVGECKVQQGDVTVFLWY